MSSCGPLSSHLLHIQLRPGYQPTHLQSRQAFCWLTSICHLLPSWHIHLLFVSSVAMVFVHVCSPHLPPPSHSPLLCTFLLYVCLWKPNLGGSCEAGVLMSADSECGEWNGSAGLSNSQWQSWKQKCFKVGEFAKGSHSRFSSFIPFWSSW